MNLTKKIILNLIVIGILSFPLLSSAAAAPDVPIVLILDRIAKWLLGFLIAFAVVMLIWAGYTFITARGDPEKIKTARTFVFWALIGVLVGVASRAMVTFVEEVVRGII